MALPKAGVTFSFEISDMNTGKQTSLLQEWYALLPAEPSLHLNSFNLHLSLPNHFLYWELMSGPHTC